MNSSSHQDQDDLIHGDTPHSFGLLFWVLIFNSRYGHSGQRILKYLFGIQYSHFVRACAIYIYDRT